LIWSRCSKQFALATRLGIENIALLVGRDVHAVQPHFRAVAGPLFDARICFGDLHATGASALHFGSGQFKTGFHRIFDVVVETTTPVQRDGLFGL
jgi:hypothetical protein